MTILATERNTLSAALFFSLSVLSIVGSAISLFSPAPGIFAGLLGIAILLFVIGRQKTDRYKMEHEKFIALMPKLGMVVVFLSVFGGSFSAAF